MTVKKLPIGTGSNLDVSDTSAADGAAVLFINAYTDRAGAILAAPAHVLYADVGINGRTWPYFSKGFSVLLVICNGSLWVQSVKGGAMVAVDGVELDAAVPPTFTEDGATIFFAANSLVYAYNVGAGTVAEISTGPTNVTSLVYIGGYLMARGELQTGAIPGDTHYSDDINNAYATWETYNNESRPDALQALVVAYEQIYNIGTDSLEVSYIDGTVPISVNKNASQHFGTPARYSAAFDGESIYYLAQAAEGLVVVQLPGGGSPTIISYPISTVLEKMERVDNANSFILSFGGQNGYAIEFPSANCEIDEHDYRGVTFFYHIQRKEWLILGQWNADTGWYDAYRGVSSCYIQPWGLRLIGVRDGKLYEVVDREHTNYDDEFFILHRWRDNGNREWQPAKTISTGKQGDYRNAPFRRGPHGSYVSRQHELTYIDNSDAGDIFHATVKSGEISYGTVSRHKRNIAYVYAMERGKGRFVLNGIEEEFNMLRN